MSHFSIHGVVCGTMLFLAMGRAADAQDPRSASQTSVVQRLGLDSSATTSGNTRELVCRGKPGVDLRIHREEVPERPGFVTMVLRYERPKETRSVGQEGMGTVDYGRSVERQPGSCSWNSGGFPEIPPEPGFVYFDLPRDAQTHVRTAERDTSIQSAVTFPDVISLPRYLSDSSRYWVFYVDDASNVSISFSRWPTGGGLPPIAYGSTQPAPAPAPSGTGSFGGTLRGGTTGSTTDRTRTSDATALFRAGELRCRGGAELEFVRGGSAGDNQVLMTLAYPVSPGVPGETGRGLAPGSCAWADRTGLPGESGRVTFVTAGNAQLRQAQSGSTVDRSPTAAERWPDSHTIPAYMADPSRYWRFTVIMRNADSAQQHGPWKPSIVDAIAGPVSEASPTRTVTRTPVAVDGAVDSSRSSVAFDPFAVRGIVITPSVNGVEMKFEGPSVIPLVQVSTSAPFQEPSTGRWIFAPGAIALSVVRDASGGTNAYSAATTTPLQRVTEYHYIIGAPKPTSTGTLNRRRREGGDRQAIGTFRTLRTNVIVRIERVRIIDDSDGGSDGELAFTFTVNGSEKFEAGTALAEVSPSSLLDLADGATYDFSREIVDADVPELLRIQATGFDNDGANGGNYDASWGAAAGGDGGGDWNHARAEYHLDQYPERSFEFPFRMRTGPGSTLQFEVEGRVSVTRE